MKKNDFTLTQFQALLSSLQETERRFVSVKEYIQNISESDKSGVIILRHDVDLKPENSLKTAILEHSMNIRGTYYFRIIKQTFRPDIILKIAELGHEIGYHYEDMALTKAHTLNTHIDLAYQSFCDNLAKFRTIIPISTICMHGSPKEKYDNRQIWDKYDYKKLDLICEPYFDIDFNKFAYLSDTGRRWNGYSVNIRDKVDSNYLSRYKHTQEIIDNVESLPQNIMFTVHPQRWNDELIPWTSELVFQSIRNVVKRVIISTQKNRLTRNTD
jgi:hypothetical protein